MNLLGRMPEGLGLWKVSEGYVQYNSYRHAPYKVDNCKPRNHCDVTKTAKEGCGVLNAWLGTFFASEMINRSVILRSFF